MKSVIRRVGRFGLGSIFFAVMFLIVDTFLVARDSAVKRPAAYARSVYWSEAFAKESSNLVDLISVRKTPVGYVRTMTDFDGRYINVVSGLRRTEPVPADSTRRIVAFGGSTTFCGEVPDALTWPSQLARRVLDNEIDLVSLMTASNAFGQGFGNKRLTPLILKYPKWDSISLDEILTVEGYSKLTANKYLAGLPIFDKFLKDNSFLKIKITKKNQISSNVLNNKLNGKVFVLSGFRDSKLESEIETRGGKISNTISSKTTALIIKEAQATSSKIDKANKLNIDIILLEVFRKKYL